MHHRERFKNLDGAFGEVYAGKLKLKTGKEVDVAVKRAKAGHMKKAQLTAFVRVTRKFVADYFQKLERISQQCKATRHHHQLLFSGSKNNAEIISP